MRFHRAMALVAVVLLCAHPLLVAGCLGWGMLTRWRVPWYLWAGRLAILVLLVHVGSSLLRRALPLAYEAWRRWHSIAAITVLGLGFVHSLAIGGDLGRPAGRFLWAGLLAIAMGAWLYARMLRPLLMRSGWGKHLFRVVAVEALGLKAFYLCCPPAMTSALVRGLRRHKVSAAHIHTDYFSI